ncbi:hypothetical protein [Methylocucumis oryzae]|uniref:Uncharacterized protein n=1 Tax=Methylocucumis oryzae TaxID=1632867 RepID=A0A0F3IL97_9GAMM|nr:hypothetical protein [Methylocucumis oryzae]KJV07496.1 hypothetical protein VZ94_04385 [Methylocucumis oryzae]
MIFASFYAQIKNATQTDELHRFNKALTVFSQFQGFFGGYGRDQFNIALTAKSTNLTTGVLLSGDSGDDMFNLTLPKAALKALAANKGKLIADDGEGGTETLPALLLDGGEDYVFGKDTDYDTLNFSVPRDTLFNISVIAGSKVGSDGHANDVAAVRANGQLLTTFYGIEWFELDLGAGNDKVTTKYSAVINTYDGNDNIVTEGGVNYITGGLGADTIVGGGYDVVYYNTASIIDIAKPKTQCWRSKRR